LGLRSAEGNRHYAPRAGCLQGRHKLVFKGGTSLEMMRIIQRFSEDLDLLVVGDYASKNSAKRALKAMITSAESATGGNAQDVRSGGNLGTLHRSAYLSMPLGNNAEGISDPNAILIELGQAGGPKPSLSRTVKSLLGRQLAKTDVGEWDDLAAFEVTVLHPGRILIEKLLRVNNFVVDPARRSTTHGLPRIGRQLYDIWALLGEQMVIGLPGDKPQFGEILRSAFEVSEIFTPDWPVPAGGFASSVAFDPAGQFAAELRQEHERAMRDLHYGEVSPPSFDDVPNRIHSNSHVLQPSE